MDGTLTKKGSRYTVRFERRLAHPVEKVWRVLAERELMKQWSPCEVFGEWKPGAKLKFVFEGEDVNGIPDDPDHNGEVLAVEPQRLLEFDWGGSVFRCELSPTDEGCLFVLSESFDDGSIAARDAAGWELCLDDMERVLTGEERLEFDMDAWRKPFAKYVDKFEPVAGPQQGPPMADDSSDGD